MEERDLLREQGEYYRARAAEYDEWFLREGRYDRGPEHRARWFREVAIVEAALQKTLQSGEVLELACGTGLWTQHLVKQHSRVVAIDASAEAIAINRQRVHSDVVEYIVADLFNWTPPASRFDAVFFGFWLSHVPPGHFDAFWETVQMSLKPHGRVFFVDSLLDQTSTARDHDHLDTSGEVRRRLNDGREFSIVKVFYEPALLEERLADCGWEGWVRSSGQFFLYGSVTRIANSRPGAERG
jgi:demethylmenaquinone methyltransferase/2-methoxy-6-polyprenyl-1,4-benzoquinol methylase